MKNNLKNSLLENILTETEIKGGEDEKPEVSPASVTEDVFQSTAFGRNTSSIYSLEPGHLCPHCHYGHVEEDISFNGTPCEFFVYCPVCHAHICTYKPMKHQEEFHQDPHQVKLYAGGFGSAKTYTCGMEFLCTVLQIPNSAGLMGAATWGQVSDTCLKFVCDNLPRDLVVKSNQDKVNWYLQLINGSRISAKPLDQEGKIRSMNLSIIWIEEASEVEFAIFAFLRARLRNKVGFFKGQNHLKMLLSSNPDVGWLNNDLLMCSDQIFYHGDVKDRYTVRPDRRDPAISTHISATSANIYLPPDYEENLAKNKEPWWINRYLKGSFKYTEGLVYPNFVDWFCEPFTIPDHWKRVTGTDFGRRDPTAHLVGALDPVNKIIYIYDEIEESLEDYPIDYMAKKIKECDNFPPYLLAFPNYCDPRGRNKDQVSGKSWINEYRAHGIIFVPAIDCEGDSLAPTINKVYTYAKHGRLKIFNTCKKTYQSLSRYKYKERTLGDDKNQGEKPQDKNNHLPDALRYLLSPFPTFPEDPDSFNDLWRETMLRTQRVKKYDYLSNDDPDDNYNVEFMDNFG